MTRAHQPRPEGQDVIGSIWILRKTSSAVSNKSSGRLPALSPLDGVLVVRSEGLESLGLQRPKAQPRGEDGSGARHSGRLVPGSER